MFYLIFNNLKIHYHENVIRKILRFFFKTSIWRKKHPSLLNPKVWNNFIFNGKLEQAHYCRHICNVLFYLIKEKIWVEYEELQSINGLFKS